MCTLLLFFRAFPGVPVLFAANRDELLDRPWGPPTVLSRAPWVFGPRDLAAGGTWLGVNEAGVLVSLANHEGTLTGVRGPSLCSRGILVLEALRHTTAAQAVAFAEWAAPACKAYTLIIADPREAFVVDRAPRGSRTYPLSPGCHVVTNARFRHARDPKAARCQRRMEALAAAGGAPRRRELARLLADHETDTPAVSPLCVHPTGPPRFGTSSASVVQLADDRRIERFLFAAGPPCTAPLEDVTPTQLREAAGQDDRVRQESCVGKESC